MAFTTHEPTLTHLHECLNGLLSEVGVIGPGIPPLGEKTLGGVEDSDKSAKLFTLVAPLMDP